MLVLGVLNIWGNSTGLNDRFGTPVYPTTGAMVDVIFGAFTIFAMLITAFYAGDIRVELRAGVDAAAAYLLPRLPFYRRRFTR